MAITILCQKSTLICERHNNQIEATQLSTHCKPALIDISSLYTNIPHEGVQNALHFLKNNPDGFKYPEQPNPDILGELMHLVLKHNVLNSTVPKF